MVVCSMQDSKWKMIIFHSSASFIFSQSFLAIILNSDKEANKLAFYTSTQKVIHNFLTAAAHSTIKYWTLTFKQLGLIYWKVSCQNQRLLLDKKWQFLISHRSKYRICWPSVGLKIHNLACLPEKSPKHHL